MRSKKSLTYYDMHIYIIYLDTANKLKVILRRIEVITDDTDLCKIMII